MSEIASYRQSFVIVALYDTLGAEAMEYIVNQTNMEFIVLSADKIKNITSIKEKLPTIKTLVVMDDSVDDNQKKLAENAGVKLYTFKDVEKLGKEIKQETELPVPEDIATICYTR
jgi:long-chain acyl-CoA synthetase